MQLAWWASGRGTDQLLVDASIEFAMSRGVYIVPEIDSPLSGKPSPSSSVAASALALEDDEKDSGTATALSSSSPNNSMGSFPLDLSGPCAHTKGAAV